jgi:hypothetical protein
MCVPEFLRFDDRYITNDFFKRPPRNSVIQTNACKTKSRHLFVCDDVLSGLEINSFDYLQKVSYNCTNWR